MSETERRSRAERRLIRKMEKRGGKGFHVLRSAEVAPKRYIRSDPPAPAGDSGGERGMSGKMHEHDVSCAFGNPTCPAFGEKPPSRESLWRRVLARLTRSPR